jgi:hypothetical protein
MSCNCNNNGDCGCQGNCFSGIQIPVGPMGPQGIQGPQGPMGPIGPQGPAGQNGAIPQIEWVEMPLKTSNDWQQTGVPSEVAYYAIWQGFLLLRGKIMNTSFNAFKIVFWDSAPASTGVIDTTAYEYYAQAPSIIRLMNNELSCLGVSGTDVMISLDSVPPIRIY